MKGTGILLLTIAGVLAFSGTANATLTREAAEAKFEEMVMGFHPKLTEKTRGGVDCRRRNASFFRCTGNWQTFARKRGVRTKFVFRATGTAFRNVEMFRTKAYTKHWEIARGVKKGPFKGPFRMSTEYR